jgi:hypothetical protein
VTDQREHFKGNIISILDASSRKLLRTDGLQNKKRVELARIQQFYYAALFHVTVLQLLREKQFPPST